VKLPQCEPAPEPIRSVVLKVASGCNLDCTYCYEYNHGDDSWRQKPATVSEEVVRLLGSRIRTHARTHGLREFGVSLHGGEPMLLGAERLAALANLLRSESGPDVELHIGMQTNATLLDEASTRTLAEARVMMGVSLDGDAAANDAYRRDKRGRGSHASARAGIECIRRFAPDWFGGILCVVNVDSDPREVFHHLASLEPPLIDFLLPHGSWDKLPPGKPSASDTRYGRWLCDAFDAWFLGDRRSVEVRYFESILAGILGGASTTEAIGPGPVALVTVGTDGAYEGVDTMKSVFPGAQNLGVRLDVADLDAIGRSEHVRMRQVGLAGLCDECRSCRHARVCGGGYFPHRYGRGRGFSNPSVYCADILLLVEHIRAQVRTLVRGT
jgi:uncharacterized protein